MTNDLVTTLVTAKSDGKRITTSEGVVFIDDVSIEFCKIASVFLSAIVTNESGTIELTPTHFDEFSRDACIIRGNGFSYDVYSTHLVCKKLPPADFFYIRRQFKELFQPVLNDYNDISINKHDRTYENRKDFKVSEKHYQSVDRYSRGTQTSNDTTEKNY